MKRPITIAVMIFAVLVLATSAAAEKTTWFGVKGGILSPGTMYVTDFSYGEFDTDMGISLGGFVDTKLGEKLIGGATVNYGSTGFYEESTSIIDVGANLKAVFVNATGKMQFKPGFGFAYGSMGKIGTYIESSSYLVLRGLFEVHFMRPTGGSYLAEIQIVGGTSGGNDDWEMSFGPGFILRGGITF